MLFMHSSTDYKFPTLLPGSPLHDSHDQNQALEHEAFESHEAAEANDPIEVLDGGLLSGSGSRTYGCGDGSRVDMTQ